MREAAGGGEPNNWSDLGGGGAGKGERAVCGCILIPGLVWLGGGGGEAWGGSIFWASLGTWQSGLAGGGVGVGGVGQVGGQGQGQGVHCFHLSLPKKPNLAGDEGGGVGGGSRELGGEVEGLTRCGGLKNVWSGGWTWARKRGGASLGTPGYA